MQWGAGTITASTDTDYTSPSFLPNTNSVATSWGDTLEIEMAPELFAYSSMAIVGV